MRGTALVTIGGWRTDLGKVNNTLISGEDHEIFIRLRRHGLYAGYYDPQVERAALRPGLAADAPLFPPVVLLAREDERADARRTCSRSSICRVSRGSCGVPRFIYRQAAVAVCGNTRRRVGRADALALLSRSCEGVAVPGTVLRVLEAFAPADAADGNPSNSEPRGMAGR